MLKSCLVSIINFNCFHSINDDFLNWNNSISLSNLKVKTSFFFHRVSLLLWWNRRRGKKRKLGSISLKWLASNLSIKGALQKYCFLPIVPIMFDQVKMRRIHVTVGRTSCMRILGSTLSYFLRYSACYTVLYGPVQSWRGLNPRLTGPLINQGW